MSAQAPKRRKRKLRPEPRAASWTLRYAVLALIVVLAAAALLGLAFRGNIHLALGAGGLALDGLMLLTLAPLYRERRLRPRDLGLKPTAPASAVGWVVLAVILVAIANSLWLQGVLGKPVQSLGITLRAGTLETILIGITLVISAPVVEEIFFRGLRYRALRNRMAMVPAALIAGFVFGAVHGMAYPLNTLPPRMVFGVIVCLLYERTGSLYPGMALHGLIDGAGFEAAISGKIGVAYAAYGILALILLGYAATRRLHARSTRIRSGRTSSEAATTRSSRLPA